MPIFPESPEKSTETTTKAGIVKTCTEDYWTEWFNLTHPDTDGGDYENYEAIVRQGNSICAKKNIDDIQCSYQTTKSQK